MFACGWIWMYAGAALMLLELVTPGFVLVFFGLSAATVGMLKLSFGDAFTMSWQLVSFSVLSVLYLAFLRRWLKSIFKGDVEDSPLDLGSEYAGRSGRVTARISPPGQGRVLVGDAEWTAESSVAIEKDEPVKVVSRRNLTLFVEPVSPGRPGGKEDGE